MKLKINLDKLTTAIQKRKLNNQLRKLDIIDLEITKYLIDFEKDNILKK